MRDRGALREPSLIKVDCVIRGGLWTISGTLPMYYHDGA